MVTFTDRALRELRDICEEMGIAPEQGVRLLRHPDPASGYRFVFRFAPRIDEADEVLELEGLRVVLDPDSARELEGYQVSFLDDLLNRGFVFTPPCESAPLPV